MSKTNTTQEIAIDFVQRAVSTINKQLAVEIERNGFSMESVRKGKQELKRIVKVSETDDRYIAEAFSISGNKIPERLIMCVKWSPKGFEIERNSDSVANAIKANKHFKIKKGSSTALVFENLTAREVEIEARASQYEKRAEEQQKKGFLRK